MTEAQRESQAQGRSLLGAPRMELPRYQCHKRVRALKIAAIDGNTITPADDGYAPFTVPEEYISKHQPQPGGYYVVYEDGYQSFSPAKIFEQGYRLILRLKTPSKRYISRRG